LANDFVDKMYELYCVEHPILNPKTTLIKALHAIVKLGFTGLTTPESDVRVYLLLTAI